MSRDRGPPGNTSKPSKQQKQQQHSSEERTQAELGVPGTQDAEVDDVRWCSMSTLDTSMVDSSLTMLEAVVYT